MTAYYVYSGAVGAANGTSWANAYTKLATAFSGKAAGDVFYVANDHSETTAGVTLTSPGTLTSFCQVVCANRAGSVPPVAADLRATAIIECSANNNMFINGCTLYNGIIFNCGTSSGASSANIIIADDNNNETLRFDNCSLRLPRSGNGGQIQFCGNVLRQAIYIELNNTTLSFSDAQQGCAIVGFLRWRNTPSALLGTVPSTLFSAFINGVLECEGVDLSSYPNVLAVIPSNAEGFQWRFSDCKLNASATKATLVGSWSGNGSAQVNFVRCGSTGVNYNVFKQQKTGTLNEETTIVRTGGASDGTTPIAWKVDTSATANYSAPFDCPFIAVWNDTSGSAKTATIQGIWGGGAVPNDDEIWVEVRYLGDASSPQGAIVSDAKVSILSTAASQAAGSGTWGGSTTKFALDVTFTAQQKGLVYALVRCAKPSSTFYIDPLVTLT